MADRRIPAADLDARRERAANAVVENEQLRGELTDDAYSPIQAWALDWVDAYALATAALPEDAARAAVDVGVAWVSAQVRALTDLLGGWSSRSVDERVTRLGELAPTFPAPRLGSRARRIAAAADAAAASIALAAALPRAPSG